MHYTIETFIPHMKTTATSGDLPEAYAKLSEAASATATCAADRDNGPLVAVGDDYSYITLAREGEFHTLTVPIETDSEEAEDDVLLIGGVDTIVARNQIAPRELGLTVLLKAPDISGLLTEYTWDGQ
ncbi:hypothetical protein KDK95_17690 [Actinospica sp. MGRD01-02]|uniref:Uncharacterized protein n=1 Tax=Actinospica acidithermotolerans TaxID=2828514 RepID=A0A941EIA6_9ACTN|nr:hypothetical protein [Actinospica acidithermotolerans]MBR7828154.1 hypothetical protein [Actinospica acidithermotolerans]